MADNRDSGVSLATNGLVLLIVMATGTLFYWQELPLQGSRPPGEAPETHDRGVDQNVDARLWQDPLAAVLKSRAEEKKASAGVGAAAVTEALPNGGKPVPDRLSNLRAAIKKTDGNVLVVGVTVPGAPYAEDAESRRRYRYAVLAALEVQKYVPEDGEHIGYVTPIALVAAPLPEAIPFEWFSAANRPRRDRRFWSCGSMRTRSRAARPRSRACGGSPVTWRRRRSRNRRRRRKSRPRPRQPLLRIS